MGVLFYFLKLWFYREYLNAIDCFGMRNRVTFQLLNRITLFVCHGTGFLIPSHTHIIYYYYSLIYVARYRHMGIQMLHNTKFEGGGTQISTDWRCQDVRLNVISITRGVGVKFPEKSVTQHLFTMQKKTIKIHML